MGLALAPRAQFRPCLASQTTPGKAHPGVSPGRGVGIGRFFFRFNCLTHVTGVTAKACRRAYVHLKEAGRRAGMKSESKGLRK